MQLLFWHMTSTLSNVDTMPALSDSSCLFSHNPLTLLGSVCILNHHSVTNSEPHCLVNHMNCCVATTVQERSPPSVNTAIHCTVYYTAHY
jgi:hypothetical protein